MRGRPGMSSATRVRPEPSGSGFMKVSDTNASTRAYLCQAFGVGARLGDRVAEGTAGNALVSGFGGRHNPRDVKNSTAARRPWTLKRFPSPWDHATLAPSITIYAESGGSPREPMASPRAGLLSTHELIAPIALLSGLLTTWLGVHRSGSNFHAHTPGKRRRSAAPHVAGTSWCEVARAKLRQGWHRGVPLHRHLPRRSTPHAAVAG